jgi:hypothetical protein
MWRVETEEGLQDVELLEGINLWIKNTKNQCNF